MEVVWAIRGDGPRKLSRNDVAHARRVVAFFPLPSEYSALAPIEIWNDVPPTAANYDRARDAILKHLHELIQQLKSD